ncbi:hypothetical protein [Parasedimentitalea psychrophila]|uniref:Uncharacterized protein n=1 Tax=Parasedimentitalea psychrophila TaxID=2997337 RepID=A0A9Y2L3J7_9RHOB|nr:hypothetical protein [Parasedimentitalea psychrophila]WIY26254.1 hypothetical protein QPJ95_04835 [Parasedimentitalea psychrophila]
MLEYKVNAATRDAIARAHAERGQVLRDFWTWLWQSRKAIRAKTVAV